jgi:hypothetical protein
MTRKLLIIFAGGLIVAAISFAALVSLGRTGFLDLGDISGKAEDVLDFDPRDKGTRTLPLGDATTLEIDIPAEIAYTQGPKAEVVVKGARRVVEAVRVEGGRVFIDDSVRRSLLRKDGSLELTIQSPVIDTFRLNGAQSMTIEDYNQPRLVVEANGAVHLEAKGAAPKIDLRMNGASNADLYEVVNDEAKVEINGASNAKVSPKTSVDIRINGVGNVSLGRRPANINKEIHGIGGVSYETGDDRTDDDQPPAPPAPPMPPHAPAAST